MKSPIGSSLFFGSLLASWFVEGAGAQPQDGLGQAHDASDAFANATPIGEIRLAGEVSAAPATLTFAGDLYGELDFEDYHLLTVRDDALWPTCFKYRRKMQVRLIASSNPSPSLTLLVMQQTNVVEEPGTSPFLKFVNQLRDSCGSSESYTIVVRRTYGFSSPYPVAYTLDVKVEREFFGSRIDSVQPLSGRVGDPVTISGVELLPSVSFQGIAAQITQFSPGSITVTVPPGARTGPITVYPNTSQQSFAVDNSRLGAGATRTTPPTAGAPGQAGPVSTTPPREAPASAPGAGSCCVTKPNPGLAGRLGRLVVAFPADATPTATKVVVLKDGRELQAGYGSQAWDLLAGTYELSISGKKIANVSVQARSDTNVRVGVLRVFASAQTRAEVVDGGAAIAGGYGEQLIGLPAGTYGLRISGQTESFTIAEGQITDF